MKSRYVLASLLCLLASLYGYAQSELPEKKQQPTHEVPQTSQSVPTDSKYTLENSDKNPLPVVVIPGADTLPTPIIRRYTPVPWQHRPILFTTLNQPYIMDYIGMARFGALHAVTHLTSYPLWGSAQDVQFFYPQTLAQNLYLYGGVAGMKYDFGGKVQMDFGGAAGLYYNPFQKIGFNLYYQHSFRQDIMHLNPTLTPMLWNSHVGFDVEFKPSENVKFRIGIMKGTGSKSLEH